LGVDQREIELTNRNDGESSNRNELEAQKLQRQREKLEYENKLRRYEQELYQALKAGYPLDEFVRNGLKQFQHSLGISDEDVVPIEQRLLAQKQAEYEHQQEAIKRKNEQVILEHQRQQAELKEQQQRKLSPLISNSDDNLSSDRDLYYTRLRDLLKAGNWKDADDETSLVMLKGVGRKQGDWIRHEELLNFPCTDLRTIDSLWVKYSSGRFGFSVQKNIYLEVGGKPDGKFYTEAFEKFIDRVGWRSGGGLWIKKELSSLMQVTFDTDASAPVGYLPSPVFILQGGGSINGMIGSSFSSPSFVWKTLRVAYTRYATGNRDIDISNMLSSYWGANPLFFSRIQACKM